MEDAHPALARVLREHKASGVLELLADQLSGADLTTLLLEVVRRRSASATPPEVLAQYERDRFVSPASADPVRLLESQLLALQQVMPAFEPVAIAPLAPLGAHSVVAGVHQNRVVTTTRGSEVAADPTNSLALEAAVRRRRLLRGDPRSRTVVQLAAVGRVVRAQMFDGPLAFAHFTLLGLVTAGRDTGRHEFEIASLREHVLALVKVARAVGLEGLKLHVSDFGGRHSEVVRTLIEVPPAEDLQVAEWPDRPRAAGYYPNVCFKLTGRIQHEDVVLADGGVVPWTQGLVGSKKERAMISGISIERLALPH